jgi:hypothetical protein
MGSFFTNVQVRAGSERSLAPLLDALRTLAGTEAMDEVTDGAETDRAIIVLPPDAGGWVAIYDEASESQDTRALAALAAAASRALDAPAVSVMVHDSDVLALELFEHGAEVDRFEAPADYFEKRSKKEKDAVAGRADRWRDALAEPGHVFALRSAWTKNDLFAEQTLRRVLELLGCDTARGATGYRYTHDAVLPEGAVVLRFRLRTRPAYERRIGGAPCLRVAGRMPTMALLEGDTLRLGATARNEGGEGHGLSIVMWGTAIDRALVNVERIELVLGSALPRPNVSEHVPADRKDAEGRSLRVVELPDQHFAAAAESHGYEPGMDVRKMVEASMSANVHVNVVGRVTKPGAGTLFVGFSPHQARNEGADALEIPLEVAPAIEPPLRVAPNHGDVPSGHLVLPLAGERTLLAMVAIDRPRADAAAIARAAIEDTLAVTGTEGQLDGAVYGGATRPTILRGKAKSFLTGKRWSTLADSLATAPGAVLTIRRAQPSHGTWGASFGTNILGSGPADQVPTLVLWASADALGEDAATSLEARWSERIDEVMRRGGVQGVVHRWSAPTASVDHLAYESACQTGGLHVTWRPWLERWIRVPGNRRLWLGPALAARLTTAMREALAPIATITPCGEGVAIALGSRRDERAMERALADLLATSADAQSASREWVMAQRPS